MSHVIDFAPIRKSHRSYPCSYPSHPSPKTRHSLKRIVQIGVVSASLLASQNSVNLKSNEWDEWDRIWRSLSIGPREGNDHRVHRIGRRYRLIERGPRDRQSPGRACNVTVCRLKAFTICSSRVRACIGDRWCASHEGRMRAVSDSAGQVTGKGRHWGGRRGAGDVRHRDRWVVRT